MAGNLVAQAICNLATTESEVKENLDWVLDNVLVQHLQDALTSASKGSMGDSFMIPWFLGHFEQVSFSSKSCKRNSADLVRLHVKLEAKLTLFTLRR
jgi:hypothetical protein